MNPEAVLDPAAVNAYLARKQHLITQTQSGDVVETTRDIAALHATDAATPFLSLHARIPGFHRDGLTDALYEGRRLVRVLCMRSTLHIVSSAELPYFHQAYAQRTGPTDRRVIPEWLLVAAGLCEEEEAAAYRDLLYQEVRELLAERGPMAAREINRALPQLSAKFRHDVGKRYEGTISVGSRLLPSLCAEGILVRTQPRGSWRSSQYEYALLADWLPGVDLKAVLPEEAQAWLVRRYLATFGPATAEDAQWWTGFTKGETRQALDTLAGETAEVTIDGLGADFLVLADELEGLRGYTPPAAPYAFLLPLLDPYIMGFRDRRRFLADGHRRQIFDRAGNAVPTVWVNGRVAGAWTQRKDGRVVYGLFEETGKEIRALIDADCRRIEGFLDGDYLAPRYRTPLITSLT